MSVNKTMQKLWFRDIETLRIIRYNITALYDAILMQY